MERLGRNSKDKEVENALEAFLYETLKILRPDARVEHEPVTLKVNLRRPRSTVPDILFSLSDNGPVLFLEITKSRITHIKKSEQRTCLRVYEKHNGQGRYRSAVLYGEHFANADNFLLAFGIMEDLAKGQMKTNKARKELNRLAGKTKLPEGFEVTEKHLSSLQEEIRQVVANST